MDLLARKAARLADTAYRPRAVDLFCGAGGFSLGIERAGFEIIGGVELDPHAAASHARNFHGHLQTTEPALYEEHASSRNIRETDPMEWLRDLGHSDPVDAVDIIIGGPPCPAYTRVGRAKLREIADHPEAFKHDSRATLYLPYLHWVRQLKPIALLMENVPEILNFGGHNLAEEICEVLEDLGYRCTYSILNAAGYGVPQTRQRFILAAVHEVVEGCFVFPTPTRQVNLPIGYDQAQKAALRPLRERDDQMKIRYQPAPASPPDAPAAVSVATAMSGLPVLKEHLSRKLKKSSQRPDERSAMPYGLHNNSSPWVATHMLAWPGRETDPMRQPLLGHITRRLSWRDFRLFRSMDPGDQYFEAYRLALHEFDYLLEEVERNEGQLVEETDSWVVGARAIQGCLDKAASVLSDREVGAQHVATLRDSLREARSSLLLLDSGLGRLCHSVDVVGLELETGAEALNHPLVDTWDCAIGYLEIGRGPWSAKAINRVASNLGTTSKRVQRAARRQQAWLDGLDSLDPVGQHRRGRECPFQIPDALTDPNTTVHSLRECAFALQSTSTPTLLGWPQNAPFRALVELATWSVLEVGWHSMSFQALKARFVPPYVPNKFPNKWRKMEADAPARTLMAHLGKDSYSHIHFDSAQARTISVREAARLQSFPDSFRFEGSMNPAFRQIGNAVPPLFAWRLGLALLGAIRGGHTERREGPEE